MAACTNWKTATTHFINYTSFWLLFLLLVQIALSRSCLRCSAASDPVEIVPHFPSWWKTDVYLSVSS